MKTFAKRKIKGWVDRGIWAPEFKEMFDTEEIRRYSGRRMFRVINRYKIRQIMQAAKFN